MPHLPPTNAFLSHHHPYQFAAVLGYANACHGDSIVFTDGTGPKKQQQDETHRESSSESRAQEPLSVLIVDDDKHFRRALMNTLLELSNFEINTEEAGTGEQSVELLRDGNNKFDCVFLDLKLPGINGIETLNRIRQLNTDVRIVLMTSDPNSAVARSAVEAGHKIFDKRTLRFDLHILLFTDPGETES